MAGITNPVSSNINRLGTEGHFKIVETTMNSKRAYSKQLKTNSRALRSNQTEAEQRLWSKLHRKQLNSRQFYRQKPLGRYIVDFYAPSINLVIEVDGSQHFEVQGMEKDKQRDNYLQTQGLTVLRFDNRQVLTEIEQVLEVIEPYTRQA